MWCLQTERFDNRSSIHNLAIVRGGSKIPHILSIVSEGDNVIPPSHSIELLQQLEEKRQHYKQYNEDGRKGVKGKGVKPVTSPLDTLVAMETIRDLDSHHIPGPAIIRKCTMFLQRILPDSYFAKQGKNHNK